MNSTRKSIAVSLVTLLVLSGVPHAPHASAQSPAACDAAIEKLERETQQLGRDLNADVREAVRTDVAETSLAGVRNHLKAKPASEAVFDLKDKWDNFNTYAEHIKNARATMDDLLLCINTSDCSLIEFAKRQNEAIAKWIKTLGDDGLTAAAERVNKAGSLLRNYAERTLNTGINGAMDTVGKCNARFEQQATSNSSSNSSQPTPAEAPGNGSGIGKIIGWTAVLGGSLAGGLFLADALAELEDLSYPATTTTTTTTSQPTSQPSASANYRWGNWDCGTVGQCAQLYNGHATGSVGPLCSQALCADFIRVNASRNTTCTAQPLFTVRSGPAAGRACIDR